MIVDFILILHFKATRAVQTNLSSKISFHFCDDCRIFCEGEWEKNIISGFGLVSIIGLGGHNGVISIVGLINLGGIRFIGPVGISGFDFGFGLISLVGISGFGFGHVNGFSLDGLKYVDRVSHQINLVGR